MQGYLWQLVFNHERLRNLAAAKYIDHSYTSLIILLRIQIICGSNGALTVRGNSAARPPVPNPSTTSGGGTPSASGGPTSASAGTGSPAVPGGPNGAGISGLVNIALSGLG